MSGDEQTIGTDQVSLAKKMKKMRSSTVPDPTTRQRLMLAAFELFEENGYEQTTVDAIAERAGVGRTTLFRVVQSKDELIFHDHDTVLRLVAERLDTATPETAAMAISEAAAIVLRHYVGEGELARSRYRITGRVPALRDREIASSQRYQLLFGRFIRTLLPGDSKAELNSELLAATVVTAHNYVLRRWLRGESSDPEGDFKVAIGDVIDLFRRFSTPQNAGADSIVVVRTSADLEALLPSLSALVARVEATAPARATSD